MAGESQMGLNRTGVATSSDLCESMIEGTAEFPPTAPGDEREIAYVREDYSKDAEPLGTVPPPPKLRGVVKSVKQLIKGEHPILYVDQLGARLGFERTGTRLWEAVLSKYDSFGAFDGGPARVDLERIAGEEFEHFRMLEAVIRSLGCDPTAITPSADLEATLGKGVLEVCVDPRTNLIQSLEAVLVAELSDNESWQMLSDLAEQSGQYADARLFERALEEENEHLSSVRQWLRAARRIAE